MNGVMTKEQIENIVWRACDTFRGAIDPSEYKNYILVMLFLKYMSDQWKDKREEYHKKYDGDKQRIERALSRERFIVPTRCDFDFLAVYIIPLEAWYLIPVGSLPRRRSGLQLFPHIPVSSSRFEKFRDAWQLLR